MMNFAQAKQEAERMRNFFRALEKLEAVLSAAQQAEATLAKSSKLLDEVTAKHAKLQEDCEKKQAELADMSGKFDASYKAASQKQAEAIRLLEEKLTAKEQEIADSLLRADKDFQKDKDFLDGEIAGKKRELEAVNKQLDEANSQMETLRKRLA